MRGNRLAEAGSTERLFSTWARNCAMACALALVALTAHAVTAPGVMAAEMADPTKPDPSIEGAPNEASGEDLYQRGFYPEALAEWKRAVEVNKDAGAAFRLGEEHFDAKVMERDVAGALKYYTLGAEWGDMRAQMDLATMFDKGWGVQQDLARAAKWYEASAKQGQPSAQYNTATMYEEGVGVAADNIRAYMYYQLAIEGGFPQFAAEAIEKLSATMKPAEIKEATKLVRAFKPMTREESAKELEVTSEALSKIVDQAEQGDAAN
jgi:tetratricopeptide (TPR) repeat protein